MYRGGGGIRAGGKDIDNGLAVFKLESELVDGVHHQIGGVAQIQHLPGRQIDDVGQHRQRLVGVQPCLDQSFQRLCGWDCARAGFCAEPFGCLGQLGQLFGILDPGHLDSSHDRFKRGGVVQSALERCGDRDAQGDKPGLECAADDAAEVAEPGA